MVPFLVGNKYNFQTIAPITLALQYQDVKLTGIIDFNIALNFLDILGTHENVQKEVGKSIPGIETSTFYIFVNNDNKQIVLSSLWIDLNSVTQIEKVTIVATINDVESIDLPAIENLLKNGGYTNVSFQVVSGTA